MVVDVANAHATTSAESTAPIVSMRPGVVHRNHQRGCAGVDGDRDANGSVEGCANSTVTCARTSTSRLFLDCPDFYEEILRADCWKRGDSGTSMSHGPPRVCAERGSPRRRDAIRRASGPRSASAGQAREALGRLGADLGGG